MAVDAGALVIPALGARGVDADHERVPAAVVGVGGEIDLEAAEAADVAREAAAVEPDEGVAVDAVELHPQRAAAVGRGQVEAAAIPADRVAGDAAEGLRALAHLERLPGILRADAGAHVLVAVVAQGLRVEGQLDGPVVRQVELAPGAVVKIRLREGYGRGGVDVGGRAAQGDQLGFLVEVGAGGALERVDLGVGEDRRVESRGVAEVETPPEIEQQPLAAARARGQGGAEQGQGEQEAAQEPRAG